MRIFADFGTRSGEIDSLHSNPVLCREQPSRTLAERWKEGWEKGLPSQGRKQAQLLPG